MLSTLTYTTFRTRPEWFLLYNQKIFQPEIFHWEWNRSSKPFIRIDSMSVYRWHYTVMWDFHSLKTPTSPLHTLRDYHFDITSRLVLVLIIFLQSSSFLGVLWSADNCRRRFPPPPCMQRISDSSKQCCLHPPESIWMHISGNMGSGRAKSGKNLRGTLRNSLRNWIRSIVWFTFRHLGYFCKPSVL